MGKYDKIDAILNNSKKKSQLQANNNTIKNYATRISAAGVDPEEALDKRNAVEKFLNLTPNQNVVFDAFELLQRPQNALFTGIANAQEGGSFLEGLKEGITKEKETQFKNILMNTGAFADEEGKINAVDVLGMAGDVFLDPADLVPVAGFGKAGKVLKEGGNIIDAYKATDSLTDVAFKGVGKAIKGTGKLADTGIEKTLKKLDETKGVLDKSGNVRKLNYLTGDLKSSANLLPVATDGVDLNGAVGRLQLYKNAKNKIKNAFNVSDAAKGAIREKRAIQAAEQEATELAKLETKRIQDAADTFAKKNNGKYGNANEVLNDAFFLRNSTVNRGFTEKEIFELIKNKNMPAYPEVVDHLNNIIKRDVPDDVAEQLAQKYGKDALSVKVDKGHIKLGKGWKDIQISNADEITAELTAKQKRLGELNNILGNEKELRKLSPYEAGELEYETEELVNRVNELKQLENSYKVPIKRRYKPEEEKRLRVLSDRYAYNKDGFRDFTDEIFGTAWKRQDSDIMSAVDDYGEFDEALFNNASNPTSVPLSKNQALVMDPQELYSGRKTSRDTINAINRDTGELVTNANSVFYTNDPDMAIGYGGRTLATADNLGEKGGVTYRGLLSKTPDENVLTIGPNGAVFDDAKKAEKAYLDTPDPEYGWQHVPYKDFDTYNVFSKITDADTKKLVELFDNDPFASIDAGGFAAQLKKKDKKLYNKLKSNGIDLDAIDRPGLNGEMAYNKRMSGNIDADNLYRLVEQVQRGDYSSIKEAAEYRFLQGGRSTDEIMDNIYKNQVTGRATDNYNTVKFEGIRDNIAGERQGDDIVTFNPGTDKIPERQFKALANKTPNLDSGTVFDIEENARPVIKSSADKMNDFVDQTLNTKLGEKYNYLTNDNYVASHILTPEGKQIVDEFSKLRGSKTMKGNTALLSSRKYAGSPEEINNFIRETIDKMSDKELKNYPALRKFKADKGAQFMETDYIKALTNNYIDTNKLPRVAGQTQLVSQNLLNDTFKNYDEMTKVQNQIELAYKSEGKVSKELTDKYKNLFDNSPIKPLTKFDSSVPDGCTKLNKEEFSKFVNSFVATSKQLGMDENSKALTKLLKSIEKNGNDIAINSDVLRVIGAMNDTNNINGLNKIYNSYLNMFKEWKTASPTNFMNNLIGNSSNMILGGVSMVDQAKYGPQIVDIMTNGEKYHLQRLAGEKLSAKAAKTADNWENFRKMGFGNASLDLAELPQDLRDVIQGNKKLKGAKDYVFHGLPALFGYLNQKGDVAARLTVMLKAADDPKFLKRLGAKDAYEAISKIMFDPEMLTSTEKKIKQLIPFYTYAKNNLVYHITNMPRNATKYNRLMKTTKSLREMATNGNDENMAEYIKNSLYLPIPGLDKDGNYKVLRAQLPFGQLIETIDNPVQQLANMSSPLVKGIYEQSTGIDTFTGRPIEEFPGEKSTGINLFGWSPSKKAEKAISTFSGLDVPLKTASRLLSDNPANAVLMQNNINTDKLSKSYNQIEDLQNLMKQYEQKGYEFSTMSELKKANYNSNVSNINAILAKYGIETQPMEQ